MKKTIAVAALMAAMFAMPVAPVQAATVEEALDSCLILPLLKRECWEMAGDTVRAAPRAAAAVASDAADAALDVKLPVRWWNCTAAEAGSGYLLDC